MFTVQIMSAFNAAYSWISEEVLFTNLKETSFTRVEVCHLYLLYVTGILKPNQADKRAERALW